MNNKKTTKRTLLSSVMSLVLCMAMLIGTTFAWFTDNATSGVNTIQSGKLDIVLEMKDADGNWVDAEGKTLDFIKADNSDTILWEPGCTYELPVIRVRNNGNLALKYELVINGVNGDAKLLEAIDFTANGAALRTFAGELLPKDEGTYISEEIVIQGHMKEEAGNEYQDKKIEGISISVFATQLAHEYDSFDNQYDKNAIYADHYATPDTIQELIYKAKAGEVIGLTSGTYGALNISAENGSVKNDLTLVAAGEAVVESVALHGSSNVILKGLTFVATGARAVVKSKGAATEYVANIMDGSTDGRAGVKNLVIQDCTFAASMATRAIVQFVPICFEEQGRPGTRAHNITVDNCEFSCNAVNYIRMNYMHNEGQITVTNNTFGGTAYGTTHNAINATGNSSDWTIKGNEFMNWNPENAAFGSSRQGTNKISLIINDNDFVNLADAEQIAVLNLKTSYTEENLDLSCKENTANYELFEMNSIPVADGNDNLYYMTKEETITRVADGLYQDANKEYLVATGSGFSYLNQNWRTLANKATVINLVTDIDFAGYTWTPLESHADTSMGFKELNGNGYTINNLTINGQAMFKRFAASGDVTVKDVVFDNAKVNSSSINSSILTVQTYQNVLLDNVDVANSTISGGYKVAPLIATVYDENSSKTVTATLKNCDVKNCVVKATSYDFCTTGLVAFVYASDNDKIEFENCTVTDVTLIAPDDSYKAHAFVYTTGSASLYNEVEGVTVTNCKFEVLE